MLVSASLANQTVDDITIDEDPLSNLTTVRGMLAAQFIAADRFGSTQAENVGGRLRMLHSNHEPCSLQLDVGSNISWEHSKPDDEAPAAAAAPPARQPQLKAKERGRCDSPLALWIGGSVDLGILRPSSAADRGDLATSGLTLGADVKPWPGLALGAALGYGRDSGEVDSDGSEGRARATNTTIYGSYQPVHAVYVDVLFGLGDLGFDSIRQQDWTLTVGGREGSQSYASLAVSGVITAGRLKLTPYGRLERVRSNLDGYEENGPTASPLGYGQVTAFQELGAAGLFASYRMLLDRASLEPSVRIEMRRLRGSSDEQMLWGADLPAHSGILVDPGASENQLVAGAGLAVRVRGALSFGVDYRYAEDGETNRSESIMATLRAPF